MAVKKYDIEIPKQDYLIISIAIKKGEEEIKLGENDLMFMTVKSFAGNKEYEFQKSLHNGIEYNEATKRYEIEINSSDTRNMVMEKAYGYDITIFYDKDKPKQKIVGKFYISDKYTLNEVD